MLTQSTESSLASDTHLSHLLTTSLFVTDVVMLDADASRNVRMMLRTLIQDCDRRQELVQELITTNTQLR